MALYCGVLGFCLKLAACPAGLPAAAGLPVAQGACTGICLIGPVAWQTWHFPDQSLPHIPAPTVTMLNTEFMFIACK
jgi:hypothetical protein